MRKSSSVQTWPEHTPDLTEKVELHNQVTEGERSCGSNMYIVHSSNGVLFFAPNVLF